MLNLGVRGWQVSNPFIIYDPGSILTDDMDGLLLSRFRGENPLLRLSDEALRDSVLLAPM